MKAINRYLPSPLEIENKGADPKDSEKIILLESDASKPFVGMAFKIVDDEYGQLTYTRVYQGTVKKGEQYYNQRTGRKERFSRIVRMHSDKREEVDEATAGDIIAIMGYRLCQWRHLLLGTQFLCPRKYLCRRSGD